MNTNDLLSHIQHTTRTLISDASHKPCTIILGLSAGPDSVCLFHALAPLHADGTITLVAAHLDHQWRSEQEAENDRVLCAQICSTHHIPFYAAQANDIKTTLAQHRTRTGSPEADARHIRHAFFQHVAHKVAPNSTPLIALAHHADDQYETFFIRLLRGSSTTGLAGMKQRSNNIIRPLLFMRKEEILSWLRTNNIPYRIDHTNSSDAFLRNRIRKTLIPALKHCDTRALTTLQNTMQSLQEQEELLSHIANKKHAELMREDGYNLPLWRTLHPAMQKRILLIILIQKSIIFTPSTGFLNELLRFLAHPAGGRHDIAPGSYVWKKGKRFGLEQQSP